MNLIIDIGNTRVKVAVFEETKLVEQFIFAQDAWLKKTLEILGSGTINKGIIAATGAFLDEDFKLLSKQAPFMLLDSSAKVPFINLYQTPKTLGVDRVALISNAVNKFPQKNVLIIDAGTCITYDFVNSQREYLGGAISPGLEMRYKALHQFTEKLPLLKRNTIDKYIGDSTEKSIHSGVLNGVIQEIKGITTRYRKDYKNLTIVLTGGDTNFLAKQLKSGIFAHPNFVLEGLNTILIHNTEEC